MTPVRRFITLPPWPSPAFSPCPPALPRVRAALDGHLPLVRRITARPQSITPSWLFLAALQDRLHARDAGAGLGAWNRASFAARAVPHRLQPQHRVNERGEQGQAEAQETGRGD